MKFLFLITLALTSASIINAASLMHVDVKRNDGVDLDGWIAKANASLQPGSELVILPFKGYDSAITEINKAGGIGKVCLTVTQDDSGRKFFAFVTGADGKYDQTQSDRVAMIGMDE